MKKRMTASSVALALLSVLLSQQAMATNAFSAGLGYTVNTFEEDGESIADANWMDLDLAYTYKYSDFYGAANYRTSVSGEYDADWTNAGETYTSDLSHSRAGVTLGYGVMYVGYITYNTKLDDSNFSTESFQNDFSVDYDVSGFTLGLSNSFSMGSSARFLLGAGLLYADATVSQSGRGYKAEYDATLGGSVGFGFGGSLGVRGLAYYIKAEYQYIDFSSNTIGVANITETFARGTAGISYAF